MDLGVLAPIPEKDNTSTVNQLLADIDRTEMEFKEIIKLNPVVIYSWSMSPVYTKAMQYLDKIGCKYKAIELDKPWENNDLIRATLGRLTGRKTDPSIWINGVGFYFIL